MILELAHNISIIWPNQLQNRTQRNAHAPVYTNKICRVINQWNWGWAERHVSPRPNVSPRPAPPQSSRLHSGVLGHGCINTTAVTETTPSFFACTFRRDYANISTS